jgi:hypothetical protein
MTPRPAPHVVRWFLRTFGFGGITLPPWGVFILAERISEERLVRHEQAHWQQYQRMGMLGFYVTYIWYTIRHGYYNNPMEVEARAAEVSTA